MSGKHENNTKSSSTDPKLGDEDTKTFDSGFISSGNIIVYSSDIQSDEEETPPSKHDEPEEYMRLDSGVNLVESFSGLDLKTPGLNDLSASKTKPQPPVDAQDDGHWKQWYQQDEDGNTFLHLAIAEGFVEAVFALIRASPHPRLLDTPNDDALTPIHLAAITKQWRLVRWLIVAGARPAPRNVNGDAPLHIAARNGDLHTCKAITDPVDEHERGCFPLRYAQQQPSAATTLDLNQWNYEGQTCVHVAAMGGHVEVLRHLMKHGADVNAREGTMGYTPLHYAIRRGDDRLAQFLIDCKEVDVEVLTYGGRSPLQLGFPVSTSLAHELSLHGAASPFTSDDEDDAFSDDDDDDVDMAEASKMFNSSPSLVNASA